MSVIKSLAMARAAQSGCSHARPTRCLENISTAGSGLPPRIVLHGGDGCGKTSLAAQFPAPLFLYPAGDTGLETLLDSGRLPPVAHFPAVKQWEEVASLLGQLADEPHDYRTLVVDGLGGLERLCHEGVCARHFDGDWGELGFHGYQRGVDVALSEWRHMLSALERLRTQRRMIILLCAASRLVTYRNPSGADYDRYCPDLHAKSWAVTQRWADVVAFLDLAPDPRPRKSSRFHPARPLVRQLSFERSSGHDAKNRAGLPARIVLPGDSPASAYRAWNRLAGDLGRTGVSATKARRRARRGTPR